jgi:D-glycero-alpha-D-manno-heptose-7-phosphate kinase
MIVSQTPLRVSLLGGGTDFPQFFEPHGGAVLTMAINKFIYVIVKERFDDDIYINYSKKEIVSSVDEVQHDLVRETLRKTGIVSGLEITTLADVPSQGTGLGSSSAVTVGLLNTFHGFQSRQVSLQQLATEACEIEIEILNKPIGIQDQYICAGGGIRFMEFRKNEVLSQPISITVEEEREFMDNLMLFYTNRTRKADKVLHKQRTNIQHRFRELEGLRDLAYKGMVAFSDRNWDGIGRLLHENWMLKQQLSVGITDPEIDKMYELGLNSGALGGKICGAGGGGFLLLYAPEYCRQEVRQALAAYRELPFHLSKKGSCIIFHLTG